MQLEQFNKIIINDDFIKSLLMQIRLTYCRYQENDFIQIIDQLLQESQQHKKEMTRFDIIVNQKLGITDETENNINDNENNENINNDENNNEENNNNENEKQLKENEIENNSNEKSNSEIKNSEFELNNSKNENKEEERVFDNLDDLVKFINEDDNCKSKKGKRGKKKKKKKGEIIQEKINEITINEKPNEEEDELFLKFKEDIINDSIYSYEINKIKPNLSNNFIYNIKTD